MEGNMSKGNCGNITTIGISSLDPSLYLSIKQYIQWQQCLAALCISCCSWVDDVYMAKLLGSMGKHLRSKMLMVCCG